MDPKITFFPITPDMVGKTLMIRGISVQHMFAEDAFGAALNIEGEQAGEQSGAAIYEVPVGMSAGDAVLDWIVRYVTEEKGRKLTITDLRDALPESLIALYASISSARGSVANAVKKGVEAEQLQATGFGAKDVVEKAIRRRKPRADETGATDDDSGDAGTNDTETPNSGQEDLAQTANDGATEEAGAAAPTETGGAGTEVTPETVAPATATTTSTTTEEAPKVEEATKAEDAPKAEEAPKAEDVKTETATTKPAAVPPGFRSAAATTTPAKTETSVASSKAPGAAHSAADREDINKGIASFEMD